MFQKELMLTKQVPQRKACFATIHILKMLALSLNHMFVINAIIFLMTAYELKGITILNVKGVDFRCILQGISRYESVDRLNNSVLENAGVL